MKLYRLRGRERTDIGYYKTVKDALNAAERDLIELGYDDPAVGTAHPKAKMVIIGSGYGDVYYEFIRAV